MKTYVKIFLAVIFIILGLILLIQEFYLPSKNVQYKYSPTEFIEPSESFLNCFEDADCIKIKGSACPTSSGGVEVCVDKDFFQQYLSEIEEKAGREENVECPEIYLVTDKICNCVEGKCNLI